MAAGGAPLGGSLARRPVGVVLFAQKKMARLEGSVRPVPKTGQTGLVKLLKKQNGLHHYIALDDQNVYVEHPIWTSNERDMGSGSSAPRADR